MASRPSARLLAVLVGLGLVLGITGGTTYAAFWASTTNAGNSLSAAPDLVAPSASASVIAPSSGGTPGTISPGSTYYVYAAVADTGNPPSGVASVSADVRAITSGQAAAPLSPGSFAVGGVSYGYRSGLLTADGGLSPGTKPYSLTMRDNASNSATQGGFSVTVQAAGPSGVDVQAANGAATVGKMEQGDTITFTYSATMAPGSILAGWNGQSVNVVVRVANNGSDDTLSVYDATNTAAVALGSVNLKANHVIADRTFGASGTPSTMVQSGASITVTLGTPSGSTQTPGGTATMEWTPSASATDQNGNPCSTALVVESGPADKDF